MVPTSTHEPLFEKKAAIEKLKKDILAIQGCQKPAAGISPIALGPLTDGFPNSIFPTGTIHEFTSFSPEAATAATAFTTGLAGALGKTGGSFIWITRQANLVFPPGLRFFGLNPENIAFIRSTTDKDALWAAEEALKSSAVTAVIAEIRDLNFTSTRRLQLAAEKGGGTGFFLRTNPREKGANAFAARWQVQHRASALPIPGMPGVGRPAWQVTLDRVKNGRGGTWHLEWASGQFRHIQTAQQATGTGSLLHLKAS